MSNTNPEPMNLDVENRQITFKEKWELYKPQLRRLYVTEDWKLPKIQKAMRSEYQFDAEIHQYKWQFKKWEWKKSIPDAKKAVLLEMGHQRARQGRDTSITHLGRALDTKKLLRYAKRRQDMERGALLISQPQESSRNPWAMANPLLGNRNVFYMCNLPYNALLQCLPQQTYRQSPDDIRSTPSDIEMISPTPSAVTSPVFSQAVSLNVSRNRAKLFVSGKIDELLDSLGRTEKRDFSTWLYQFWYYSFKTAKHWGRGPATWTASDLWPGDSFRLSPGFPSRSPTPSHLFNAPSAAARAPSANKRPELHIVEPTPLCQWSIHILQELEVDWLDEDNSFQDDANGEWPVGMVDSSFEQKLQQSLETNSFSTINTASLPVSAIDVAKAVKNSPEELFKQSFAFAIMSRNLLLVERLCEKAYYEKIDLSDVHPYHLAATYLDGARSCCQIMYLLRRILWKRLRPNILGPTSYTILDNLMITILRNHSSTSPETIDTNLRGASRFGGEDVDICGRWDADSDCYQSLLRSGSGVIPLSWKHKFCHTSAQAVCHAMIALNFRLYKCPASGIFMKRCFTCGLKLQLPPMHMIVVTAFHLAQFGCRDEDLFGMICCVLCFIVYSESGGESEIDVAQVSIDLLLGHDSTSFCTHESLTAAQLAKKLASALPSNLSSSTMLGWSVICQVLQQVEDQHSWSENGIPPTGYEDEHAEFLLEDPTTGEIDLEHQIWGGGGLICDEHVFDYEILRVFGRNRLLGHIWAACQCELLTYRRLGKEERWVSKRIDVSILDNCLRSGNAQNIPLIQEGLVKDHCLCGSFLPFFQGPYRREDACSEYFSNLDDWSRTTFLNDEGMIGL